MKKSITAVLLVFLIFLTSCQTNQPLLTFSAKNDLLTERKDQLVELSINNALGKVPEKYLIIKSNKMEIPSQLVDNNSDGVFDAIIFLDDFGKKEKKNYTIHLSDEKPNYPSKVFATYIEGREDIAWENDCVAFRMYGPALKDDVNNGIDVWSKSVNHLIIEKWYKEEEAGKSYHTDHGEGADFYSVGKSLGSGGSAIWFEEQLYQSGVYTEYKILENGPLRLRFELIYKDFDVAGLLVTEKKTITLDAGSLLNHASSEYKNLPEGSKPVAGLVIREGAEEIIDTLNSVAGLWRATSDDAENGYSGIGLVSAGAVEITKIKTEDEHLVLADSDPNLFEYYAGAVWSKSTQNIKSAADWQKYMAEFHKNILSPIKVEIEE